MAYTDRFSFYRSSEWESFRASYKAGRLARDGELICDHCGKSIVKMYDAILHHVTELDDMNVHDATVSLNPDNIQLICHACHNKEHDRWQGGRPSPRERNVYVVWGSPCAGKRAWVNQRVDRDDLIVDIDALYDALNVGNRKAVTGNVMRLYKELIDMVKTRNGRWRNAYVIRTLPLRLDREAIVRDCGGAELVHIDTPKDVCLMEAERRGGDWVEWVEQYWNRLVP